MDWLCFAKPFKIMELALLRKAKTISIDLLCFAKPILYDGLALLRKAFPSWWMGFASQSLLNWWIGFASQSQSISKPIHFYGLALLRKAIPLWRIGFASQRGHLGFFSRPFLALSIFPGFRMVFVSELRACGVHPVSRCAPFLPVNDKPFFRDVLVLP